MDEYRSHYISVVPRLLPSQSSAKKFPMSNDGYEYFDNSSNRSHISPTTSNLSQPLSTRTQLNQNYNHNNNNEDIVYPNRINSSNERMKNGMYHQALKDNSGTNQRQNSYFLSQRPHSSDNWNNNISNNYLKRSLIVFSITISLFAITALSISIYVLVKMTSTSSTG